MNNWSEVHLVLDVASQHVRLTQKVETNSPKWALVPAPDTKGRADARYRRKSSISIILRQSWVAGWVLIGLEVG